MLGLKCYDIGSVCRRDLVESGCGGVMDFLAVAAAAGAGYAAKYLHKMSKENDEESSSSSANAAQVGQERGKKSSLNDTLNGCDGSYTDLRSLGGNVGRKMNTGEESTIGKGLEDLRRYQECNLLSLASLPPGLDEREIFRLGSGNLGGDELRESSRGSLPEPGSRDGEFAYRLLRSRSVRSRRPYSNFVKPLNSLESCLTAQINKKNSAMENYVLSPLPSPSTTIRTRPLLVTDGNRVISRANSGFQSDMIREVNKIEDKKILGAPLSKISKRRSIDFHRRLKQNNGGQWCRNLRSSSATVNAGPLNPQGSPNGMLLFYIGVTIGILSTAVTNKREVDKLNELLKQSKNLVQDLQEEIEMKDSMTVKELVSEKVGVQESYGNIVAHEDPTTADSEKSCSNDQTAKQSEIMSQIEAELEAELERLELNMKGSTLERIADFVELDPDYEADVTKGEFGLDTITKRLDEDTESDEDRTFTDHADHANRPVSPRDLSLRLHEVIEARLNARIIELETALADSQKRVRSLEHSSIKTRTTDEKGSHSPQSPPSLDDRNNFDQPLVINLAGDALDAYNEAYEEIFRMVKTEDETPPDTTTYNNIVVKPKTTMPSPNICVEERSPVASIEMINWQEQLSKNLETDDESEDDDILGQLLIQQIVEKTRQGSPLVLNAQRLLYSMDE